MLYVSTHQFPFYPGTGALDEHRQRRGPGSTVNVPLPAGCGDAEYGPPSTSVLVPCCSRSARAPAGLGRLRRARTPIRSAAMPCRPRGFAGCAARLCAVADEVAGGRIVLALEGGYDLEALGESVAAVVEVLAAPELPAHRFPAPTPSGMQVARKFREAYAVHWPVLRA